jgi:hypothetical protein
MRVLIGAAKILLEALKPDRPFGHGEITEHSEGLGFPKG